MDVPQDDGRVGEAREELLAAGAEGHPGNHSRLVRLERAKTFARRYVPEDGRLVQRSGEHLAASGLNATDTTEFRCPRSVRIGWPAGVNIAIGAVSVGTAGVAGFGTFSPGPFRGDIRRLGRGCHGNANRDLAVY